METDSEIRFNPDLVKEEIVTPDSLWKNYGGDINVSLSSLPRTCCMVRNLAILHRGVFTVQQAPSLLLRPQLQTDMTV